MRPTVREGKMSNIKGVKKVMDVRGDVRTGGD